MKYSPILFLLLLILACQKNHHNASVDPKVPPKKSPFLFVPRAGVKWILHSQGRVVVSSPAGFQWDSSFHTYVIVTPTGFDSVRSGFTLWEYVVEVDEYIPVWGNH